MSNDLIIAEPTMVALSGARPKVEEFLVKSKRVDATLEKVPLKELRFVVEGEQDEIRVYRGQDNFGLLSDRGIANLSRLTKVSPAVLFNQSDVTLDALIHRQLAGNEELSFLRDPDNAGTIIAVSKGSHVYTPYDSIFGDTLANVIRINGDPITNDSVTALFKSGELDDTILTGGQLSVSSTGLSKATFGSGLYRVICANGAVDTHFLKANMDTIDNQVLKALLLNAVEQAPAYIETLQKMFAFARSTKLNRDIHWHLLNRYPIPSTSMRKYKGAIEDPGGFNDVIVEAHASGTETLYDSFNILTSLAKDLSASSRASLEANAFTWLQDTVRIPVL